MASTQGYRPRVADAELEERLAAAGTVLIEGPRASGKTWTAQRLARSQVLLDVDETARRLARLDPAELLAGPASWTSGSWSPDFGIT